MEDKSFLYYTQDEIIDKLDIDPRLIEPFKRVMHKIQEYFNAHGYTQERDYASYLRRNLLESDSNNLKFVVQTIDEKGVLGFFSKKDRKIAISEELLKNDFSEGVECTLCHEFIHFLVMLELSLGEADIFSSSFINEALTEMLTQEIYPNSNGYDAQVAMHKYANLLSGKVNNYSRFLQGFIDARYSSHEWSNYVESTKKFQNDFKKAGYITLEEARNNENYINAQRCLINLFLNPRIKRNFFEYVDCMKKLDVAPIQDREHFFKMISSIDINFIRDFSLRNPEIEKALLKRLEQVRSVIVTMRKMGLQKIFPFTLDGQEFALDENYRPIGVYGMQIMSSPNGKLEISYHGKSVVFYKQNIQFISASEFYEEKLQKLSSLFTPHLSSGLNYLQKALQLDGDLQRVEKFELPMINSKQKRNIYVAIYENQAVVLNGATFLSDVESFSNNRFIGMTSRDPKIAAIYSEPLGVISKGMLFSILNEKQIHAGVIGRVSEFLEERLSQEEIEKAISAYQESPEYYEETGEELKQEAIRFMAIDVIAKMPPEAVEKLREEILKKKEQFVVFSNEGHLEVSLMHSSENKSSFRGSSEVLFDKNGMGIYQEFIDILKKGQKIAGEGETTIPIDSNGSIAFHSNATFDFVSEISLFRAEKVNLIKKLDEYYFEGNLPFSDWQRLKKDSYREYESVISSIQNQKNEFSNSEYQRIHSEHQQWLSSINELLGLDSVLMTEDSKKK